MFSDYIEAIQYLFSCLPMYQRIGSAAYKADLSTTIELDKYFNHPHRSYLTIHVAGTNGKGSVSHMLASVLQSAGYKTGLYTSPHLIDFRERIRINGKVVDEEFVLDFVNTHKKVFEDFSPSFFEMTAAMAFEYFSQKKIDVAVIETGMGGRLDSTNIIAPVLSVITNIGLDHVQFLGETIEKIAVEKAGIIKNNIPVVVGESQDATDLIFIECARENNSSITFADKVYNADYALIGMDGKQTVNVHNSGEILFKELKTDLNGIYQQKNIITCLAAIDVLIEKGMKLSRENIYDGLSNAAQRTGLMGRWQILGNNPLIVCDTGHNESGIREVVSQIHQTPYRRLHIVFGMVGDKSIDKVLQLLPKDADYYFTRASIPRSMDEKVLKEKAKEVGLEGNVYPSVESAYITAKSNAGSSDFIFIGGSTFVVADLLEYLRLQ